MSRDKVQLFLGQIYPTYNDLQARSSRERLAEGFNGRGRSPRDKLGDNLSGGHLSGGPIPSPGDDASRRRCVPTAMRPDDDASRRPRLNRQHYRRNWYKDWGQVIRATSRSESDERGPCCHGQDADRERACEQPGAEAALHSRGEPARHDHANGEGGDVLERGGGVAGDPLEDHHGRSQCGDDEVGGGHCERMRHAADVRVDGREDQAAADPGEGRDKRRRPGEPGVPTAGWGRITRKSPTTKSRLAKTTAKAARGKVVVTVAPARAARTVTATSSAPTGRSMRRPRSALPVARPLDSATTSRAAIVISAGRAPSWRRRSSGVRRKPPPAPTAVAQSPMAAPAAINARNSTGDISAPCASVERCECGPSQTVTIDDASPRSGGLSHADEAETARRAAPKSSRPR